MLFLRTLFKLWLLCGVFFRPAFAMSEDEVVELLFPPAVMHEKFRVLFAESFGHEIERWRVGQLSPPFPPGALTDEQLRAILTTIDALATRLISPVDPSSPEIQDELRQLLRKATWARLGDVTLRPQDVAFLREQREFELKTQALSTFHLPLRYLAPHKLKRDPSLSALDIKNESHGGMDNLYVHWIIDADVGSVLPARFNLNQLRQLSQKNKAMWDASHISSRISGDGLIKKILPLEASRIWAQVLAKNKDVVDQVRRDMLLLLLRIEIMVNPMVSGYCSTLGLDGESVNASGGDWHKVKLADNSPLNANSFDMGMLVNAHARGCYVRKDIRIARKLLQQWADAVRTPPMEGGKLNVQAGCKLALWMRHGVGGERNSKGADALELRVKIESGASCDPRDLRDEIDPSDPMRDLRPSPP